MSGPAGVLSPIYEKRQLRAEKLAQRPAAKEILAFYVELLKLQEPVYRTTLSSDWLAAVREHAGRSAQTLVFSLYQSG